MAAEYQIGIVIPVHNRMLLTRNCLNSLQQQTFNDFQIIIVDDGSSDGTKEMLAIEFPDVKVLTGDGNLWWTAATNLGVKYALENGVDYILTLNNDTIPKEDFLEKMIYWAKKKPDALLGAFAIDSDTKKPIYCGEILDWKKVNSTMVLDNLDHKAMHGITEVSLYPGRGLFIPKSVFEYIGYYDSKRFPHYAADYDFTHRAIRAGYHVYCNLDAKLYIFPSESGNQQIRRIKNIRNYYLHLFAINGGGNLVVFFRYAYRNCPKKYLMRYLLQGSLQRILGYWIHK
jgi:GT2 family glycosyltransferase